jgi:SAM-dependent methyltransferase
VTTEFDRVGDRYEELVEQSIGFCGREHDFYLEAKAHALLDLVRRRLGNPADVRVLDVGCGVGGMHRHLRAFGELEGADPSEAMIDAARVANPDVRYHVAPGERLPLSDGAVDLTLAVAVLHHVEPEARTRLLRELARVTRPGGLCVVFEHNPLNPLTRLAVARCEFDEDAVLLGPREAERRMRAAALQPTERRYILFFPWRGRAWQRAEAALRRVPLGAQYYVAASRA